MEEPRHAPSSQRDPLVRADRGLTPAEKDLWGFEEELRSNLSRADAAKRQTMVSGWARVRSHLPSDRRVVAGLAVLGVAGALLIGLSSYDVAPSMTTLSGTTYSTVLEPLASAVNGALEVIGVRSADPVATADVAPASTSATPSRRRPAKLPAPLDSGQALQLPLVSVETARAIQPAPIGHGDGTPQEDSASIIYSTDDIDVSPPVAIRSPGHVDGGKLEDSASLIEILVSETGVVEWTKERHKPATVGAALQSTTALSVVKTWRFRPALKDGHPVKYRTTVRFVQTMSPAGMREGPR